MRDNFWLSSGRPNDLECPPSGGLLRAKYSNNDRLSIEFFELPSVGAAQTRYPKAEVEKWDVPFPLTAVEVNKNVAGTPIKFSRKETELPVGIFRNCFMRNCAGRIRFGSLPPFMRGKVFKEIE